jgi:serine/threonine protein kinase
MVYEWMDKVLRDLPSDPYRQNSDLPRLIAQRVLEALDVLHRHDIAHLDVHARLAYPVLGSRQSHGPGSEYEPLKLVLILIFNRNIFLSAIESPDPIVKLGDLGLGIFTLMQHVPISDLAGS